MASLLRDGTVLVAGGSNGHFRLRTSTEIYRPHQDRWVDAAAMDEPHRSMIRLNSHTLLVAGGQRERERHCAAERYFVHRDVWRSAGSYRGRCPDPGPRLVRLASGDVLAVSVRTVRRYDASQADWDRMPSLPRSVQGVSAWSQGATRVHGRVLVLSSHLEYDRTRSFGVGHIWRPASHRWVRRTTMPRPLDYFATIQVRPGAVLVAGGVARYRSREGGDHVPSRFAYLYAD
jgi:hypothetical protein